MAVDGGVTVSTRNHHGSVNSGFYDRGLSQPLSLANHTLIPDLMTLLRLANLAVFAIAGACVHGAALAAEITVYTAFEAEDLVRYKTAFEKVHPEVRIRWVRDSTGIVTAKLLAEKDNPRADAIWGLAASSLVLLKSEGMLQAYAPKGLERVEARFRDSSDPPAWVGGDAWAAAMCVNTVELKKRNLPMPGSWEDLVNPAYRGQIAMPNPASSGTGYLDVSGWLQMWGEDRAWSYMDRLHQNIAVYTHSGSKPCKDAARGEVAIGISFDFRAAKTRTDGAPIEVVVPSEGVGWDSEAAAIVKGTDFESDARKLMDFAISDTALAEYNKGFAVLSVPGKSQPVPNFPADIESRMIRNDFDWAARNRERLLAEWSRRYDGKSERK